MQKLLIVLVVGILAVGCETIPVKEPPPTVQGAVAPSFIARKADRGNTTKAEPVKELTPEEQKGVGTYEFKEDGNTYKEVLLENGVWVTYRNGEYRDETTWSIVDGEIHINSNSRLILVHRINADKSITQIATIFDGKRTDFQTDGNTSKKIK